MWARTFERAARLGLALSLAACAADDAATAPRRVPQRPSLVTAAAVTVTNTNDAGPGSLREAIANAASGSTIQFDLGLAGQTIVLTSGQLVVEQAELTIEGPATAGMIINGNSESAVFFVGNGATTLTTFRNLTLTNGQAAGSGGAIRSSGRNLTLDHVLVTGNRAVTSGLSQGHGGAVSTTGVLSVVNSTISGNSADVDGGGIDGSAGSSIIIVNSTIVGNSAATGGGISSDGPVQLRNSIVAGNSATPDANCHLGGSIRYTGVNIASDASCGTDPNLAIADPQLVPLGSNGGPTKTHALLETSPAIDAAVDCTVTDDQRYVARPQGRACDIGAFEFSDFVKLALTADPSGSVNPTNGVAVVSGTMTCSAPATIPLSISLSQTQKLKRVPAVASASGSTTITCAGKTPWAVALATSSGGFEAGATTVTANTVDPRVSVLPASLSSPVNLVWQKKK